MVKYTETQEAVNSEETVMNNEQVMHHFEGVLLPAWFYESPKEFLGVLAENSGALHEISSELFRRAQLESPFSAADFSAEPGDVNDEVRILSIKFPAPSEQGLCHRAICFFDKTFTKLAYYTLEKGMDLEGSFPVLGFFDERGEHSSYGIVSPDKDEQFVQCVEIYMGKFFEK